MDLDFLKNIEPMTWGIVALAGLVTIGLIYLFRKSSTGSKYLP